MKSAIVVMLAVLSLVSIAGSTPIGSLRGDDIVKCGQFHDTDGNITVKSEGKEFSVAALNQAGAFASNAQYPFGCWAPIGKDDAVRGTFMYSYSFTTPGGEMFDKGPYGIWVGGSGSGVIVVPSFKAHIGIWIVEYFTVRRDNGTKSSLGKSSFLMKD